MKGFSLHVWICPSFFFELLFSFGHGFVLLESRVSVQVGGVQAGEGICLKGRLANLDTDHLICVDGPSTS